ncbi:hypothetical protein BZG36_01611 [Bifiguratus adelaidae]|uniref:Autophagy-related protein 14 n=1 Tax=Bifiguratus adelaidae TaxID=1938954 RepID=A0A261Y4A5_9FUNG|nr:hypothetical protein BZG36_01611 [Bifiguratus adelaidae]
MAMECSNCQLFNRKFVCVKCLRDQVRKHSIEAAQLEQQRQDLVEQANFLLANKGFDMQQLAAEKRSRIRHIATLNASRTALEKSTEADRQRLQILKYRTQMRRETLVNFRDFTTRQLQQQIAEVPESISDITSEWRHTYQMLIDSKRVLVLELCSLFDLRKTLGGVDSLSRSERRKARANRTPDEDTADLYTICGLRCPSAKIGISALPREELNAAIGHVIHLISLLVHYLGIKLPYLIVNKGVFSYIRSTTPKKQSSNKMPLFLTDQNTHYFTIGLAMLNYDIAYLCHTQGLEIPMQRVANMLQNLSSCCRSRTLGRYSHHAIINSLPDQSFSLNFNQVLRMTSGYASPLQENHFVQINDLAEHDSDNETEIDANDTWDIVEDGVTDHGSLPSTDTPTSPIPYASVGLKAIRGGVSNQLLQLWRG